MLPVSFIKTPIRLRPRIVTTNVTAPDGVLHTKTFRSIYPRFFFFPSFFSLLPIRRFQCKCKSILWFMFFCYVKFSHWEFIVTLRAVFLYSFLLLSVRTDFPHWNIACYAEIFRQPLSQLFGLFGKWKKREEKKLSFFHTIKVQFVDAEKMKIQRQFSH